MDKRRLKSIILREMKRRKRIKTNKQTSFYLRDPDGTIYSEMKSLAKKIKMGRTVHEEQVKQMASIWYKRLMLHFGWEGSKDWNAMLDQIRSMSENPSIGNNTVDFIEHVTKNFYKQLLSVEVD